MIHSVTELRNVLSESGPWLMLLQAGGFLR